MTILWVLAGFVIYSLVIVPILARLALRKEWREPLYEIWIKVWKIKKKSFLIRYFYRDNCAIDESRCVIVVPKDICQLYVGIYLGLFFGLMYLGALSITLCVLFGPGTIFAFFLGYLPTPRRFFIADKPFKKMKYKTAPWKIFLPMSLIVGTVIFHKEISGVVTKIPVGVQEILSQHPKIFAILGILWIIVFVFLALLITRVWETRIYKKAKEALASFVKKHCKEIEVEE